jgi:hypothetical protein
MQPEQLIVVYHVAGMGDYQQVAADQLRRLHALGLDTVLCTHVGAGLDWLQGQATAAGVRLIVEAHEDELAHYETRSMELIERLAQTHSGAFLYLHTKGVSAPGDPAKARWRNIMQRELVDHWQHHLANLGTLDVIGVDWIGWPPHPHFSGNYWLARADWIRRLPRFASFHASLGFTRFSCEFWLGQAPGPRVGSLFCRDLQWWEMLALDAQRERCPPTTQGD